MGTCNFWMPIDNLPLYVMDSDKMVRMYGLLDEDATEWSNDDYYEAHGFVYSEFGYELERLNDALKWYKVSLKDGYYDGVQIYIDTDFVPIDDKELPWTDEDAYDYFQLDTVAEICDMIKEEQKRIKEFLYYDGEEFGFECIRCIGLFSNGEAVYERVQTKA